MTRIHPTAIIDPEVTLGENVEIGPWCYLKGKIHLGDGNVLQERVSMEGPLIVGEGNTFYSNSVIGRQPQDYKFSSNDTEPGVVIGDRNLFREGVTVHRATHAEVPTRIGNDNFLMVNSHVAHDVQMHNHIILVNGSLLGGHTEVFDRVILGGNAATHQFTRVGRLAMISGASGITQDLPPFCISYYSKSVASLNLIGLRRNGYRDHIKPLKLAFDICFKQGLNNKNAAKKIEEELADDPLCIEFAEFIKTSQRGIGNVVGYKME